MEVIGTEGRLYISKPFVGVNESEMILSTVDEKPIPIPVPVENLYLGEVEDMHSAILDNKPNYLSLLETRNHIRTVIALYESAIKGEVIKLI
jgi:predicted dehydrogenase